MISKGKIVRNLISFILKSTNIGSGDLPREYTNLQEEKSVGNIMIEDLGDTLPFLYWAGQEIDFEYARIADRCAQQLIKRFQKPSGLFSTENAFWNIGNFDKMTDICLGLNLMYELTKNLFYLDSAQRFFDGLNRISIEYKGFIPLWYSETISIGFPFSTGKFGLYIEELCTMYEYTNNRQYLALATNIAAPWIHNKFFRLNGLFPFVCTRPYLKGAVNLLFKKKIGFSIDSAMSSKANTNVIYGLIALYRHTKDQRLLSALHQWYEGVCTKLLNEDGSLYSLWEERGSHKFLGCDHAVIDCLLELYRTTEDKKFLNTVERITHFWIGRQDSSGLIPQGVPGNPVCVDLSLKYGNNPEYFRLDPQTDFCVVLMKLYQLTGNKKYYICAQKINTALCTYHRYNDGFVDVLDHKKHPLDYTIDTKFLFLVLKVLLSDVYLDKNRIYKDKTITLLLRDR